jgi:hypothetical protein
MSSPDTNSGTDSAETKHYKKTMLVQPSRQVDVRRAAHTLSQKRFTEAQSRSAMKALHCRASSSVSDAVRMSRSIDPRGMQYVEVLTCVASDDVCEDAA